MVGVDISLRATAFSGLEGGKFLFGVLVLREGDVKLDVDKSWGGVEVCFYDGSLKNFYQVIKEVVKGFVDKGFMDFVLEGYSFGSVGRLTLLGEYTGVLKLVLEEYGVRYSILSPGEVKKMVVGRGSANKSEVSLKMYRKLRKDFSFLGSVMEDMYDASAVAWVWEKRGGRYD